MATIPIYQSTAGVGRFGPVPQAPTIDVLGPGLDVAQGFAGQIDQLMQRKQQQDAVAWSALTTAQATQEWTKQMLDRQQKAEPGAPDFTPSLMRDFDAWTQAKLAEAPNDEARQAFEIRAMNLKTGLFQDATKFEVQSQFDLHGKQASDAVQIYANTLLTAPGKFDQVMQETGSFIMGLDLPPAQQAAMLDAAHDSLAKAAVYGGIDQDPAGTLKALRDGKWDTYLTPDGKLQAMNRADAELKRRDAEARAAASAARADYLSGFQDEIAFLSAGGQLTGPTLYSRDSLVATLGAEKGNQLADARDRAEQTGQLTRDISTMPQAEVETLVRDMGAELLTGGAADYRARADQFKAVVGAAKDRLGSLAGDQQELADAVKAEDEAYLQRLQNEVDFIAGGGQVTDSEFSRQSLVSRFGDDIGGKLADHRDWVQKVATASAGVATASAADALATVDEAKGAILSDPQQMAEKQAQYEAVASAYDARTKALASDPAGYAINTNTAVRAAYNDMVTAMTDPNGDSAAAASRYAAVAGAEIERLTGQPAGFLLPKSYVDQVAQQFSDQKAGGENAAQLVQGLQQLWGKNWPAAYGQLVQQGALPSEAVVIGSGVPPATANLLAEAALMDVAELKKGFQKSDLSGLGDNIASEMNDFRVLLGNYAGGDAAFGSYYDAVEKLALMYMRRGASASEAATQAFEETIGNRYTLHDTFFVPVEEDPDDAVASGAAAAREDLSAYAGRLDLPQNIPGVAEEETRAQYVSTLESSGYWITAPDQSGLVLMDPTGAAATVDGGKPLLLTWQQLRSGPGPSLVQPIPGLR